MNASPIRGLRPGLLDIARYVPGKPLETLQREIGMRELLKFASNENPLGPSPRAVAAAAQALAGAHRYADAACTALREALAARLGVSPDHIVPGCGSNELILLACQAFAGPGDEVLYHHPSFLMYPIAVRGHGATPVAVPGPDLGVDLDAMRAAVTPRTRMVFLCSPNNPTGDILRQPDLERFVAALPETVAVVIDEAYHEFVEAADAASGLTLIDAHPRRPIVVLRTFSKAHGLAGLRVGYGVMRPELADVFHRLRQPFDVSAPAQAAAIASLSDVDHIARSVEQVRAGRAELSRGLRDMGVRVRDGHGNFLFCEFPDDVRPLFGILEREGIILRPLVAFGLDAKFTRITIGTADENARLLAAFGRHRGAWATPVRAASSP